MHTSWVKKSLDNLRVIEHVGGWEWDTTADNFNKITHLPPVEHNKHLGTTDQAIWNCTYKSNQFVPRQIRYLGYLRASLEILSESQLSYVLGFANIILMYSRSQNSVNVMYCNYRVIAIV